MCYRVLTDAPRGKRGRRRRRDRELVMGSDESRACLKIHSRKVMGLDKGRTPCWKLVKTGTLQEGVFWVFSLVKNCRNLSKEGVQRNVELSSES